MDFSFLITKEMLLEMTWGDWEMFENPTMLSFVRAREILSKVMVDTEGQPIPPEKASEKLRAVKTPEMLEVLGLFAQKMREAAIPPASGSD